jgi:hypothetical protein
VIRRLCQQVAYEVNSMTADFLAIATQGLVNAKYRGSQILYRVYPARTKGNQSRISLPNWLSNCHAATVSNFSEFPPPLLDAITS